MKYHIMILLLFIGVVHSAQADLKIFACEPEWASLVTELGGEHVNVYTATTAYQDPHHIQARPSLIARLRSADLSVCTGAELEVGWMPMLQRQAGNSKVQAGREGYFAAAMQVSRLGIPEQVDRSMGDVHAAGNPHVHLDPDRLLKIANSLSLRMQTLDPIIQKWYENKLREFDTRWTWAIERWKQKASPLKGTLVVTHHQDWAYLLNWLEMEAIGSLEPKPGLPPSAAHLAKLKQQILAKPVKMVIRAAYQDARPSQWLQEQAGIRAVELPYTVGGSEKANDLFGLYDDTLDRLVNSTQ